MWLNLYGCSWRFPDDKLHEAEYLLRFWFVIGKIFLVIEINFWCSLRYSACSFVWLGLSSSFPILFTPISDFIFSRLIKAVIHQGASYWTLREGRKLVSLSLKTAPWVFPAVLSCPAGVVYMSFNSFSRSNSKMYLVLLQLFKSWLCSSLISEVKCEFIHV